MRQNGDNFQALHLSSNATIVSKKSQIEWLRNNGFFFTKERLSKGFALVVNDALTV